MQGNKRGQDLFREVDELREEKVAESECDRVKSPPKRNYNAVSNPLESPEKSKPVLDEIEEKLKKEKSLNKALKLSLRNTKKSNAELLLALEDSDKKMEEKNTEIERLCAGLELERKKKREFKIHQDVLRDNKFSLDYKFQSEYSKSLTAVKQSELHVKRLEERVIQAEEALRESELINATVVENLQDELKRLSVGMTSNVYEKEKRASPAQNLQELLASQSESLRKEILKENKRDSSSQKHNYYAVSNPLESLQKLKPLIHEIEKKLKKKNIEIEGLWAELELERKKKREFKIHKKDVSRDNKFSLDYKFQSEYSKSLTTIKQYELHVKSLEEKIENQGMKLSQSLDTISELETHIERLETHIERLDKEFEKQGHDFEHDVEHFRKVQEERAIQAEKALSESKLTNATVVETLQGELKRLSVEMTSNVNEKQKLASQAQILQEALGNSRQELKKETEKLQKELTGWKSLMSEKNAMIKALQLKLKMIEGDYNGLKQRLVIESEKVNFQNEEIKVASEVSSKHDESRSILGSAKSNEGNDEEKLNKLLSEVSSLDKRNRHLESELKEMQYKYSEVSLRFAEVEGVRQQLVMDLRNLRNAKK